MSEERLSRIEQAVERIERGIFGDDKLDQAGIVRRVKDHERRLNLLERLVIYVISGGAVVVVAYKIATDWWPRK